MRSAITTHSTEARVSMSFIVKLSVPALCARPVNSSVMSPLRIDSWLIPAAPLLNDVWPVWIMRGAG
jgi:hypothetical protein